MSRRTKTKKYVNQKLQKKLNIISLLITDKYLTQQDNTINSLANTTGAAIYDKSLYDVAVYPSESPMITLSKLGQKLRLKRKIECNEQTMKDKVMTRSEKIAANKLDKEIDVIYRTHCSNIAISMFDIPRIFDVARKARAEGRDMQAAIIQFVDCIRKN